MGRAGMVGMVAGRVAGAGGGGGGADDAGDGVASSKASTKVSGAASERWSPDLGRRFGGMEECKPVVAATGAEGAAG